MKEAGSGFVQQNVLRHSASLSYYTIFSIGPMMLVIIFISSIFFSRQAIEGTIYSQIGGLIGKDAAIQIQNLIKNTSLSSNNFIAFIGFTLLLFAATTIFTEIQDSMNAIWDIKVKANRNWQQLLKNRLVSFLIITCLGLLLLVFLIINGLFEGLKDRMLDMFPRLAINLVYASDFFLTLAIVSLLFAIIYKVLPDIYIQWKYAAGGAIFASMLFMIGKFGVTMYINHSSLTGTYNSAGSFVILLLWIYYSAIVLYFGAEVTKAYAFKYCDTIKPKSYAVGIRTITLENDEISMKNKVNISNHILNTPDA
ncbi:MAG: YihY/virulence factor BrkB family protein [Methanococcaceae archaeon]